MDTKRRSCLAWATSSWAMRALAFTWCGRWKSTRCRPAWSVWTAERAASFCWSRSQNADRIILIDAAADGNPPGTVTRTTPHFSRDYPPTLTAHDIGVKDLLDAFYMQGGTREVVLYAIAIDPHAADFDGALSDDVREGRASGGLTRFLRNLSSGWPAIRRKSQPYQPDRCQSVPHKTCNSDHFGLYFVHGSDDLLSLLYAARAAQVTWV